jgi:hypothetical protein
MFKIANEGLPVPSSSSERRDAAIARARAWQDSAVNSIAGAAGRQTEEMGQMAATQLDASRRNIEQGLAAHQRKKAEEEANKGSGLGGLLGTALTIGSSFLPGVGPAVGAVAGAATKRFLS